MAQPESGYQASGVRLQSASPLVHVLSRRNTLPMIVAAASAVAAANNETESRHLLIRDFPFDFRPTFVYRDA